MSTAQPPLNERQLFWPCRRALEWLECRHLLPLACLLRIASGHKAASAIAANSADNFANSPASLH
jgi:hypothetical protein